MPLRFALGVWIVLSSLILAWSGLIASPPPEPKPPVVAPTAPPQKPTRPIRWRLDRNFAHGMMIKPEGHKEAFQAVRAVDVDALDPKHRHRRTDVPADPAKPPTPFAVWSKKFDDPNLKPTNGYASVVDEKVFTDLRMVDGQSAANLDAAGVVVGRVKLKDFDAVELTEFLVASGIIDANIHVQAAVTGEYFASETGHWFALHSDDPYWTNQRNQASYDFGVHIAPDGTIRLLKRADVGRVPPKAE